MAEAVFRHKVDELGLSDSIQTDSAGVSFSSIVANPHDRVIQILSEKGISCSHQSRRIQTADLSHFDYVLAADTTVLRSIWGMGKGKAKVQSLMKYALGSDYTEIPDPIKTDKFELTYDLIDKSTDGLLKFIRETHEI